MHETLDVRFLERLRALQHVQLVRGPQDRGAQGLCLLEAVALLAGEPHGDRPQCVCPAIAAVARTLNDQLDDADRNRLLRPMIPRLVDTRGARGVALQRSFMVLDWVVRYLTRSWLEGVRPFASGESDLARLAPIVDRDGAEAAQRVLHCALETVGRASRTYFQASYHAALAAGAVSGWAGQESGEAETDRERWSESAFCAVELALDDGWAAACGGDLRSSTARRLRDSALDLVERMLHTTTTWSA